MCRNAFQIRLTDNEEPVCDRPETVGAHPDLARALLARHVEDTSSRTRDIRCGAQRDTRLPDAGITDDQHHGSRYHTTAQDAVKFARPRPKARHILDGNIADGQGLRSIRKAQAEAVAARAFGYAFLRQGVPCTAARAFAKPLGRVVAAFLADENRLSFLCQNLFAPPRCPVPFAKRQPQQKSQQGVQEPNDAPACIEEKVEDRSRSMRRKLIAPHGRPSPSSASHRPQPSWRLSSQTPACRQSS